MLFLLGAWLALLAVCVPIGLAILGWTRAAAFDRPGDRVVVSAWLGLIALGSGLLALAVIVPLSPLVGAAWGLAAAGAALWWHGVRDQLRSLATALTPRLVVAFLALAAGVAIATAQPIVWFDMGLYHGSAIRWLSDFGAVEGTGLIHHRLGFGSTWFALAAPFNPDSLRDHAGAVMGGFATLLLCLHAVLCLGRALRRTAGPGDWLIIAGSALLIPVLVGSQKIQASASPDLPLNLLALLVGWTIVKLAEAGPADAGTRRGFSPGPAGVPLLLAFGAFAVKPLAAPVVAVAAAYYLVVAGGSPLRRFAWAGGLGCVVVAPWLAYEFLTTGCPAFPVQVCADVPWSIGAEAADRAIQSVEVVRYRGTSSADGLGWVGSWLSDDLSPWLVAVGVVSAATVAAGAVLRLLGSPRSAPGRWAPWVLLAGLAGVFVFLIRAEELFMVLLAVLSLIPLRSRSPAARWLLALGLAGIVVTIYAAPDPRFAFGYMALLLGRLVVYFPRSAWARIRPHLVPAARAPAVGLAGLLAVAAVAAALAPIARPTTTRADVLERFGLVIPPAIASSPTAIEERSGIAYRVPADGLCWVAELPCAPSEEIDPGVVFRDSDRGIAAGFALR